jgi:hypothetical protein
MPKTIEQIWTENNFPTSWKVLQDKVNKAGLNMPPKDVVTFLKSKSKWTLLNAAGRPNYFNSVVAKEPGSNYMVDIIVYDRWEIKNYKYILSCIDIHSRYAEGVALTRKTGAAVTQAMLKIFKKMGRVPHTLQMDNGGEFTGKAFKTAMEQAGVKVLFYSDVSDLRKQSVIERHNRTLAGLLRNGARTLERRTGTTSLTACTQSTTAICTAPSRLHRRMCGASRMPTSRTSPRSQPISRWG